MSTATRMSENDPHKIAEVLSLLDKVVLEMIRAQQPLARVLESLCLKIEERSPGLICSVLLLDNDGRTLRDGAAPSLPGSYRAAVDGTKIGPQAGSCGTAAYRQQPVVVTDIARDPLWADYRQLPLTHGLRACWSMPISSHDGTVLGTFACYYRETRDLHCGGRHRRAMAVRESADRIHPRLFGRGMDGGPGDLDQQDS